MPASLDLETYKFFQFWQSGNCYTKNPKRKLHEPNMANSVTPTEFFIPDKQGQLRSTRQGRVAQNGFLYQAAYAEARLASLCVGHPCCGLQDTPARLRYDWGEDLDEILTDGKVMHTQCKRVSDIGQPAKLAEVLLGFAPKLLWTPSEKRDDVRFRLVCSDTRFSNNKSLTDAQQKDVEPHFLGALKKESSKDSDLAKWRKEAEDYGLNTLLNKICDVTDILYLPEKAIENKPAGSMLPAESEAVTLLMTHNVISNESDRQKKALEKLRSLIQGNVIAFVPESDKELSTYNRPPKCFEQWDVQTALFDLQDREGKSCPFRTVDKSYLNEQIAMRITPFLNRKPEWKDVVRGEHPDIKFVERDVTGSLEAKIIEELIRPLQNGENTHLKMLFVHGAEGAGKSTLVRRVAAALVMKDEVVVADAGNGQPCGWAEEYQTHIQKLEVLGPPVLFLLDDTFSKDSKWFDVLQKLNRPGANTVVLVASDKDVSECCNENILPNENKIIFELPPPSQKERERLAGVYGVSERVFTDTNEEFRALVRRAEKASLTSSESELMSNKRAFKLYGREKLLSEAEKKLCSHAVLLIYGLRGNGKSELIKELGSRQPLADKELIRITVYPDTTPAHLFRQFASVLGETAESPVCPQGSLADITAEIRRRFPNPRPARVWLEQAHHLLDTNGFRSPDLNNLLKGLIEALEMHWHWILELRERPPQGFLGETAATCEVLGLDKDGLRTCLLEAAPAEQKENWTYTGNGLKKIHGWLGGGHGSQAHTHATQLLIEVALGHNETPLSVLERHLGDLEEKVENVLMGDLYTRVLSFKEQKLLHALSLYRTAIPHDHADMLMEKLELLGAWDGLDRRCLLSASSNDSQYYLHSFIAAWVRSRQLGQSGHGEDTEAGFTEGTEAKRMEDVRVLHKAIATCWLGQLRSARKTNVNIERALEAFHHLVMANDTENLQAIAVDLLAANDNLDWARRRVEKLYEYLHKSHESKKLHQALQYAAILDPDDHKVQRFLGESWTKEEGKGSEKALKCFTRACELDPSYPPYLANLGKASLEHGEKEAQDFLHRLETLEQKCIDDHVVAIQADCLMKVNKDQDASKLRMEKITSGSQNAVFYNDEAKWLLKMRRVDSAKDILDLAERNKAQNEHTKNIRDNVLRELNHR